MTTVTDVIARQNDLYGLISRSIDNLNKLGSARITRGAVQSRLGALKANWEKFNAHHDNLVKAKHAEIEPLQYVTENVYALCEEKFHEAHGFMLDMLDQFDCKALHEATVHNATNSATGTHSRRLPRIDLPKFSGDYAQWRHFRDLFTSIVTENNELSDVEKLHYLKMSLTGEPAQQLQNIPINSDNFKRSWELLVTRYDNKRVLIDAQLAALFAIRKVKTAGAKEIKKLLGDVKEALDALEALECPVKSWDHIIVFMIVRKLDVESLKEWETTLGAKSTSPSFGDLEQFLVGRVQTLESIERVIMPFKQQAANSTSVRSQSNARAYAATAAVQQCAVCSSGHYIASYPKYLEKTVNQRREVIVAKNLCFNCLEPHHLKACRTTKRCRFCRKQHHSSLHVAPVESDVSTPSPTTAISVPSATSPTTDISGASQPNGPLGDSHACSHIAQSRIIKRTPVLLATALVAVISQSGEQFQLRALLDQGSEASFISESAAQLLKLSRKPASVPILGIGAHRSDVSNGRVSIEIISRINSAFSLKLEALVLPKLTAYLPPTKIASTHWPHIDGLRLADPKFAMPRKIDLVLGASVYAQILESGIRRGNGESPIAQKTALGWILSGQLSNDNDPLSQTAIYGLQCSLDCELLDLLQRFWQQEEIALSPTATCTPEEAQCEHHFTTTHFRDAHGRFVVRLPFRKSVSDFGDSRAPAFRMLHRMESRFETHASLKTAYTEFLREYLELDHMRLSDSLDSSRREFFLPHHGVIKDSSSTTKLRVVFKGSQKTNRGMSLNDCLHIGPKLQTELTDIIIRWRRHRFVFAADIEKMYRQIRVHQDDWPLQQILWRNSPNEHPREYLLCTVTYGLACAPYLALRCLQQLALESETTRAFAAEIIRCDTYVDDILSGADTIATAEEKMQQLQDTLTAGGFKLKKWIANSPDLLANISAHDQEVSAILPVGDPATHHALGVQWNRLSDRFMFSAPSPPRTVAITKRAVLSFIARIFDPLGWLAPIIITAKIFMQELWAIRLDWDSELPDDLKSQWIDFLEQFKNLSVISIPPWFGTSSDTLDVQLHGFSDVSQHALAATVYIRVVSPSDTRVTLVSAKTKVTPLKRVTIPRLELSAAVLLVKLIRKVRDVLDLNRSISYLWTDSTVTLAWIKSHPSRWKEFVQHRVSFIQELSNSSWHHIAGKENPADLASRGVSPQRLQQERLWWSGPQWLQQPSTEWPASTLMPSSAAQEEERVRSYAVAIVGPEPEIWGLEKRYSSLTKLLRITAWIRRAVERFRKATAAPAAQDPLTPLELDAALAFWIRLTQVTYFSSEIQLIRTNKSLPKSSSLLRLIPFIDTDELLHLRGRLQHSQLDRTEKHPLILPRNARLTELIIDHHHRKTLHGGTQLTLSSIRRQFWILGGRLPIRSFIRRCVVCTHQRAATGQQLMGQLPASRVTPCRPFYHTGVDYAGPLTLKTFRGRGAKTYKGYFIIFTCFSTSAIHLEVATDYSTEGFIAAYKRFTSRRGLCSTITSDCGTNFVGADAELQRLFKASSREWSHIAAHLANDGVAWRFNPPSAPHFGGKWEAGVKSVKFHLRRVIGETLLTYEELTTLLAQIEAILNSRPLTTLSDDPSDVSALTPGHFLVGSVLNAVPEPSLHDLPVNRLSRWQLLRQMIESFWQRWAIEYLSQFQVSSKWHRAHNLFQIGALVLVKDEQRPPTKWPLARIIDVHPGSDGLIRVATVKTATSTFKRPIVKLCLLPKVTNESNQQ
ncbi:PREDICTED: uncharacterized protein LOC108775764 [Cyphomyrmex costatus]|uniref:uncharacterized protein LOC108775764 n=1 Tax=Cyphomyrmex costatus TaxID=456900 RepID=UPI00085226DB|nr:PREDICTED: uncharacterized protein LOC108775764 [Cyphomyrmex costatus]